VSDGLLSQRPFVQTSRNAPYMLSAAITRFSSNDTACNISRYVLPVSWMTLCRSDCIRPISLTLNECPESNAP